MREFILFICVFCSFLGCQKEKERISTWSLILKQPGTADVEITRLPVDLSKPFSFQKDVNGISVDFTLEPKGGYTVFKAIAKKESGAAKVYFSLRADYTHELPYNFNGPVKGSEIYRQSPHDVNAWITEKIAKQAVPAIALKRDSSFIVAINGSPALYNNFTSQGFYVDEKFIELSSGDDGKTPGLRPDTVKQLDIDYNTDKTQIMAPGKILAYYHPIDSGKSHIFEGILFESKTEDLNGLRKDVNQLAAQHFSNGKYEDYFGALSFTTAYMNLRINDTGKSKYWVVPSVEYANTQYGRDAFWISMMLSPDYATECMKSELAVVDQYAEYPLFAVIWAYRSSKEEGEVDLEKVQAYVDSIEMRVRNNYFHSYLESDGRLDFQYWGDVIAFDKDDVVTYNQGLFALAMAAAKEMGLNIKSDPIQAQKNYQAMFNKELGFYPISRKKNTIFGPDPLVPDLLSQIYFDRKMLSDETVKLHYDRMVSRSKTKFGFKTVCMTNGDYLPSAFYDVSGYISQMNKEKIRDGGYFRGGSYFLYDNLFLIDAYLHGIEQAEDELVWRASLDFEIGSTTYECLNTKTGEPWKPNMGWNVAIYSIWRKVVDEGKASSRLFDHIDEIVENND